MYKFLIFFILISCATSPKISDLYQEVETNLKINLLKNQHECDRGVEKECISYLNNLYLLGDPKKAFNIATAGCNKNVGIMCAALGSLYLGDADFINGEKYLTASCNLESPFGCQMLSVYKYRIDAQSREGLRYSIKACKLGEISACNNATLHSPVNNKFSQKAETDCRDGNYNQCTVAGQNHYKNDNAKSQDFFEIGCKGGNEDSCYLRNTLFNPSVPIYENINAAKESCEKGGLTACANLAIDQRLKIPKNARKYYLNQTCLTRPELGCKILGKEAFINKNYPIAKKYFKLGCLYFDRYACNMLGHTLLIQDKAQRQTSYQYFELACNFKFSAACLELGILYAEDGNNKKSLSAMQTACNLNNANACLDMGRTFLQMKNKKKALNLFTKACDLNNGFGCLAKCHLLALKNKETKALRMYLKGCSILENSLSQYISYCSDARDYNPTKLPKLQSSDLIKRCNLDEKTPFWSSKIKEPKLQ